MKQNKNKSFGIRETSMNALREKEKNQELLTLH